MVFNEGDFVEVEYSLWSVADNGLMATTDEGKAKEAGIYDKNGHYGPALVVIGSGSVVAGLDKALRSMDVNVQKRFTFKPADAFGERNEELVRVMPIAEFRKREIAPYVGMQVSIDNVQAIIKSINSGRVVVDANHPCAGREVAYDIKIVRALASDKEKIEALGRAYGASPTKVEANGASVTVSFNDSVRKNADYFIGKANLVASIFTRFNGIEAVNVNEEYKRPKEGSAEKDTEE